MVSRYEKPDELEIIVWTDAYERKNLSKEVLIGEEAKDSLVKVASIGYVFKEDDEALVLIHDENGLGNITTVTIPKGIIVERHKYYPKQKKAVKTRKR